MIDWEQGEVVVCSQCRKPLTIPSAHIHFHYGTEGLSEAAVKQLQEHAGAGHGDAVGKLGQEMCMACFRELLSLIAAWRQNGNTTKPMVH